MKKPSTNLVLIGCIIWLFLLNLFVVFFEKTSKIGVVDMPALVSKSARQLAARYPNQPVPNKALQTTIERLKNALQAFSRQHSLLLLNKSSVLTESVPDYTESIEQTLNDRDADEPADE